jgi:hypothetical protein
VFDILPNECELETPTCGGGKLKSLSLVPLLLKNYFPPLLLCFDPGVGVISFVGLKKFFLVESLLY